MSLIELFIIAVGLSMDAFAVSICKGLSPVSYTHLNVVGSHLHHVGQQFLGFLDSVQHAIVPAVGSIVTGQIVSAAEHIHHSHG